MQTLRYKRLILLPVLAAALAAGCGGTNADEPTQKQHEAQQEVEAASGNDLSTPEKVVELIKEEEPEAYGQLADALAEVRGVDLRDPFAYGIILDEFKAGMGQEAIETYGSMGITPAELLDAILQEEGF